MTTLKVQDLAELIPNSVGSGAERTKRQNRTLRNWALLAASGLTVFYQKSYHVPSNVRAAALGLVFPGAGFIACANLVGGVSFVVASLLLPVTLFAWFGAGGIAFPIALWLITAIGAYFAAGETVFEYGGVVAGVLLTGFVVYLNRYSAKARKVALAKRDARNEFLPRRLKEMDSAGVAPPPDAERELSLEDLRMVQHAIDQGLRDVNDWTGFSIIDQFQTSALRYQLYEIGYSLGAYQGVYAPNFHGYLSQAHRNTIEKSITKKVMGFWKWEALWGKFTTHTDPVKEDNIMVTGFLLLCIMLYTANTGDTRYTEKGSLNFQISDGDEHPYDLHSMDESLVRQWKASEYCLFPCEPNWIYTPCNFQGITGQVIYDRFFGKELASQFKDKFEVALNRDFTEPDGSILPIRSELTGFTIPGLCGALTDAFNAVLCRGYLNHIARRMWAIFRQESVRIDEKTGEVTFVGLVGADQIDTGSYKPSEYNIYSIVSIVAGEYGDEQVRTAVLNTLRKQVGLETMETGATRLTSAQASLAMTLCMVRGSILRREDWRNLITKGPSKTTLAGPILDKVPYPGVLVAKARSHTSEDLDLVLYPSAAEGTFSLGIKALVPGRQYSISGQKTEVADSDGKLTVDVPVKGRTQILISPVV